MVAAVNRKEAFQFLKRTITPPTETNPVLESTNRLVLNRDIHFKEIHDIFLDRTLSPCRVTDEPLNTAFRSPVAWSPIGLLTNQKLVKLFFFVLLKMEYCNCRFNELYYLGVYW